ncbi:NUDIX hydrolase [Candidatus Gracilibacteria bacterium]|nr:NUDIX hydrolase [Candidatus Gracilibacteria bacterium]
MSELLKNEERFLVATKCCILVQGKILILGEKVQDTIHWELPGGKISKQDKEKEIISSLEREVLEELGLNLSPQDTPKIFHIQKSYEKAFHSDDILPFIFICYLIELDYFPEISLSDEHTIHRWITPSEIDNISPWRTQFDTIVKKAFEIKPI